MAEQLSALLTIIDAIEQLTPTQRRQLQRRLYASGLFVPDTLLTDQNRLTTAPALGNAFLRRQTNSPATNVTPAALPPVTPTAAQSQHPAILTTRVIQQTPPSSSYRSPVSGTVVLGTPNGATPQLDPHLMPPLPGQAPEEPIAVIVDRGAFTLHWPGEAHQRARLNFSVQVTDQEALYDTLIRVIEIIQKRLTDAQADPKSARLDIRSGDALFIRQARGDIPCDDIILQVRRNKVRELLQHFGGWRMSYGSNGS